LKRWSVLVCVGIWCVWAAWCGDGPRAEAMGSAAAHRVSAAKRNVLILHSYHATLPWTEELTRGILSVLSSRPYEVEIWTEYLDSKRVTTEEAEQIQLTLKRKYSTVPLDMIITTDDDALSFLLGCPADAWCRKPVVYCGVGSRELIKRAPREQFTGLEEVLLTDEFLSAVLGLRPGMQTVVVLTDNSATGVSQQLAFEDVRKQFPRLRFEFLDGAVLPFEDVLKRLKRLSRDSLVIATMFTHDHAGRYIPPGEAGRRIAQASPVPVVSRNTSELGQGFLAGNANNGFEHGRRAALIAAQVLDGERPEAIPLAAHGVVQLVIDEQVARQWGVERAAFPRGSIVVNRGNDVSRFYEDNRPLVWGALAFALLQSGIIAALVVNRLRRRRAEEALRSSQAHLERADRKSTRLNSSHRL